MQGCSGYLLKILIENLFKWIKNRNTRTGLAVSRCAGLVGRPAKFEFLFWPGVTRVSANKTIIVN
ncbi:MAG: hypothetical protein A2066_10835 [Bacteroidetes bacterium GWB2_41_8]|nr:MAG: hypothetical protein A2066_10835 [Bacteroidetes bacterium GWB2_41_8]